MANWQMFSDYSAAFQAAIQQYDDEFKNMARQYFEYDRGMIFDDWLDFHAVGFCHSIV